MRQRANIHANQRLFALLLAVFCTIPACDKPPAAPPRPRPAASPTVASLMPAATDLIIGMGARDHLVAVSYQDADRPELAGMPRVGDYQNFDWEKLSVLKPDVIIVFMSPDRIPAALHQRVAQANARLVNMRIERIADIFTEINLLGDLLNENVKATQAAQSLQAQLDAVRRRVEGKPRPRVLLIRETTLDGAVGRETFLNDALSIAGGHNAHPDVGWPNIDRETLVSLKPQVVFHLLPGASAQVVQSAQASWAQVKQTPSMRDVKVHIITDWWVLQPGMHVAKTAAKMADLLHAGQ